MMTKAFIQKRIREQLEYIDVILRSNRTDERKKEIIESAAGVLKYFNEQNTKLSELNNIPNDYKEILQELIKQSEDLMGYASDQNIIDIETDGYIAFNKAINKARELFFSLPK